MNYIIFPPEAVVQDTIYIISSKSISNRMLVIRSLAGSEALLENLSKSDDTRLMLNALNDTTPTRDVGHAGTAMRFLTACFAVRGGPVVLTGSERLRQRPVGPLVDALRSLGAGIEYPGKEGFPPVRITRKLTRGGEVTVRGDVSSQFISALMMIGPVLEGGLLIRLRGEVVSDTYLRMTLRLMNRCGIDADFSGDLIRIPEQPYRVEPMRVESDWSAASYWYMVAALLPGSSITLPGLTSDSLQGDSVIMQLFEPLGVETRSGEEGITVVSAEKTLPERFEHDFTGCPDLVQTCACTLCALGVRFRFTGTRTLRIKETDRIAALQKELSRLGFVLKAGEEGTWIAWEGDRCDPEAGPVISTYHDHRMAMSFAPLAVRFPGMAIRNPMEVTKSYPAFWDHMRQAGFRVEED